MAKEEATNNFLSISGVTYATAKTYIMDVLGINYDKVIIKTDKNNINLTNKRIQEYSINMATNSPNCSNSGALTLSALDRVVLKFNRLENRGMDLNVDLINIINSNEAVRHCISIYCHIVDTNTISPDDIKLPKTPKGNAQKLTQFYDWYEKIVLNMDKYTSIYGFTPGGYLLRTSEASVNYAAIDRGFFILDQFKSFAILDRKYYRYEKY